MSISRVQGSGQHILIVDDMEIMRISLGRFLEKWGFAVDFAVDGEDAVKKFKEHQFALIIMDVNMPKMNGFDATRAIRAIEAEGQLSPTPIVGNTSDPSCAEQGVEAGMNACNAKISGMDPLARIVTQYVLNKPKAGGVS